MVVVKTWLSGVGYASPYNTVSHTRCSGDGRPSFDSDSCMMLKEMVWNWRKLNVIGGTAFASEGAADEFS